MTSRELIDSGILELYVMGIASHSEQADVEIMASAHPEIRQEIAAISAALEEYALANATQPNPVIKPMLMASIDYSERIKKGEPVSFPPLLHENSTPEEYAPWLSRPDMNISLRDDEDILSKIIGYTQEVTTAIVWIKNGAPPEIHDDEYEKFLILEGTCDITIGHKINHLVPGDYLSIPLHITHSLKVTSPIACKVILQRVAA